MPFVATCSPETKIWSIYVCWASLIAVTSKRIEKILSYISVALTLFLLSGWWQKLDQHLLTQTWKPNVEGIINAQPVLDVFHHDCLDLKVHIVLCTIIVFSFSFLVNRSLLYTWINTQLKTYCFLTISSEL